MKLTDHFSLAEFTRSATATQRGIDNTPNDTVIVNLLCLCQNVLEPLRQWYGRPITIGSGYRCKALNTAVGGVTGSQHMTGEAADLSLSLKLKAESPKEYNAELRKLFVWIQENCDFDQLILERNSPSSPTFWIHVSCRRDASRNRHHVIHLLNKYPK